MRPKLNLPPKKKAAEGDSGLAGKSHSPAHVGAKMSHTTVLCLISSELTKAYFLPIGIRDTRSIPEIQYPSVIQSQIASPCCKRLCTKVSVGEGSVLTMELNYPRQLHSPLNPLGRAEHSSPSLKLQFLGGNFHASVSLCEMVIITDDTITAPHGVLCRLNKIIHR